MMTFEQITKRQLTGKLKLKAKSTSSTCNDTIKSPVLYYRTFDF